jgi:hypothetical protein
MKSAAKEVCVLQQNEDVDVTNPVKCGISCDSTLQRRGHSTVIKRVCYGYVDRYRESA